MRIQGITIEVSDLATSKAFYEEILGFQPGEYYEPTKWQPYAFGDQYFAIREIENKRPHDDFDITNFELDDVEGLWARVKDSAEVVEPRPRRRMGRTSSSSRIRTATGWDSFAPASSDLP
jgi:catechol 2,3-dioxygenase-like lactoylglutathione lyase family enzyme